MLAARQGRLPDIIIALLDYGEDPSGYRAGKTLLRNLKSLLVFWQEHYLHKVSKSLFYSLCDSVTHPLHRTRTVALWRRVLLFLSHFGR